MAKKKKAKKRSSSSKAPTRTAAGTGQKPSRRTSKTAKNAPASSTGPFSLVLPLGTAVRIVLEGLTDTGLVRYLAPEQGAAADDVGRLQVQRNRQWVDVPGIAATASVVPRAETEVSDVAAESLAEPASTVAPDPDVISATSEGEQRTASPDMLGTCLSAVDPIVLPDLREIAMRISTAMDPRLQLAMANRQTGKPALALASTTEDEVAVVARVQIR